VPTLLGFQDKLFKTRYARKAKDKLKHLRLGAEVVVLVSDGKYPVRELGIVKGYDLSPHDVDTVTVELTTGDDTGKLFTQELSNVDILLEKSWEETAQRVATAIASVEEDPVQEILSENDFYQEIKEFNLVPSGRILNGAGDDSNVTLFNCYVIGFEPPKGQAFYGRDSRQAIFHTMGRISEIMARGGGVGTCLSPLRPQYAPLSQTKGRSSGSVHTGNMLSSLTSWVEQANRRGAQMLTLGDFHPDVFYTNDPEDPKYQEDFIGAKIKPGFMEGNNSSILISDAFMEAVENDDVWHLRFPDTSHPDYNEKWNGNIKEWEEELGLPVIIYKTVKARDMWKKIVDCNWASAEPGILFVDRINAMHNGAYMGYVQTTNPCGEQPLLENSTCNLSAVNLGRMLEEVGEDEEGKIYAIDWGKLGNTVAVGTRFLDNVLDATFYFSDEMKKKQLGERRLGLGIMGLHDLLIGLRVAYGSEEGNAVVGDVMAFIRDIAYLTSVGLAEEKGSFPLYNEKGYMQSGFVQTLPLYIQERIRKVGIRNLTLLTIAPTGTTGTVTPSLLDPAGSVSTGCEPHFAMKYDRLSRIGKTTQYAGVAKAYMDRNPGKELPDYYVGAMDLSPEQHATTQGVLQKYVDSSISKTVNAPADYTADQVAELYMLLFKLGCKGGTIYRDGSRYEQILTVGEEEPAEEAKEEIKPKAKGKYDDWKCGNCGSEEFHMVEGCPMCKGCGQQSCSL
jgi:ribonucleoside-diphosphate reductase alpha chain